MDEQEKTDPASEHKLKKARQQGSVSKSQDANYAFLLLGMLAIVYGMGERLVRELSGVLRAMLSHAFVGAQDPRMIFPLLFDATLEMVQVLAAPFMIVMICVAVGNLIQVGWTVSFEPLSPDFKRINPAEGLKKVFSMRSVYELFRALAKVGAVALVICVAGAHILSELPGLAGVAAPWLVSYLIETVGWILIVLFGLFLLFAMADFLYSRREFLQKMKMSKQEVKDEYKQREGDPRIKNRLRELRNEWLRKSRAVKNVSQADVLLVNPTHLAIAIAYRRDTMDAPRILAKGAGGLAVRMKDMARRHRVLVIENAPLARAMYPQIEAGGALPEAHYADVARILAWVFAARSKNPKRQY